MFKATFNPVILTVSLLKGRVFMPKVLQTPSGGRSSQLSEMIGPPRTIQMLLLCALCYFDSRVSIMTLHATHVMKYGSAIGLVVQKAVKVWSIRIR